MSANDGQYEILQKQIDKLQNSVEKIEQNLQKMEEKNQNILVSYSKLSCKIDDLNDITKSIDETNNYLKQLENRIIELEIYKNDVKKEREQFKSNYRGSVWDIITNVIIALLIAFGTLFMNEIIYDNNKRNTRNTEIVPDKKEK